MRALPILLVALVGCGGSGVTEHDVARLEALEGEVAKLRVELDRRGEVDLPDRMTLRELVIVDGEGQERVVLGSRPVRGVSGETTGLYVIDSTAQVRGTIVIQHKDPAVARDGLSLEYAWIAMPPPFDPPEGNTKPDFWVVQRVTGATSYSDHATSKHFQETR